MLVSDMTSFCSFWRTRDDVRIKASYTGEANRITYTVVLTNTSSETISGLTLALGDPVRLESHDNPYAVRTMGNKIIFEQIAPSQAISFTAVCCEVFLPLIMKN